MNLRRLAAVLAIVAVALLAAAEFSTVVKVTVGSLEVEKRSATGGANHGYALLVIACAALGLTVVGLRWGSRSAGAALAVLGVAALVVALAIDLPDTRESGTLPESLAYENARARAGTGFGLELAGGVLLVAAGVALGVAGGRARGRTQGREARSPV